MTDPNPILHESFRLFGVTEEMIRSVLAEAMAAGGVYADLFFEHKSSQNLILSDREVNGAGIHIDFGVGIRVVVGDQTGYSYVENTELSDMIDAARLAAKIALHSKANITTTAPLVAPNRNHNYYPIRTPWEEVELQRKAQLLMDLNDLIFESDETMAKVRASLSITRTRILIATSDGVLTTDDRPLASLSVTGVMQQEKRIESDTVSRSFRMGYEMISAALIGEISNELVNKLRFLFEAEQPIGGEMAVVMAPGASGILLHEAIGHAFEADFNRKGISIFCEQQGKKICNPSIQIVDDGTLPGNRGSLNVDDEGVDGQKTYLVCDGVLNSYLHDRMSARHYGVAPTGNGRRESFRSAPLPRMRSTYMESGNDSMNDMIESINKGIFVDSFQNGQVQIGAGDFTFYVKSGYLIENGKLTQPIKDINIIGNGPQALRDISMVGSDLRIDNGTWTCGKEGQAVAVTCGMPSVKIDKLTVGGINE